MLSPKEQKQKITVKPPTKEEWEDIEKHLLVLIKNRNNWCENNWLPALLSYLLLHSDIKNKQG